MSNPSTDFLDSLLVQLICLIIAFALKCSKRRQRPHLRSPFQWLRLAEVKCSRPPLTVAAYVCIYIKADLPLIIFYVPGANLFVLKGWTCKSVGSDLIQEPASSGHTRNWSFWHFFSIEIAAWLGTTSLQDIKCQEKTTTIHVGGTQPQSQFVPS